MAHGVNDNLVRRWVVEAGQHGGTAVAPVSRSLPAFVPVRVPGPGSETAVSAGIHIELRRGPVAIKMTWPVSASSECAAWMRELLR